MFRPRIIRYVLVVVAVYLTLIGLMFVFQQGLAETVFAIGIRDPSAHRGWGVSLLVLAALAGVLARRPLTYVGLLWLPIAGLLATSAARRLPLGLASGNSTQSRRSARVGAMPSRSGPDG